MNLRPTSFAPGRVPCRLGAALLAALCWTAPVRAQSTGAPADAAAGALDGALEAEVRRLAGDAGKGAARGPGSTPPRVEVVVGRLDPRLRLAPCRRVEPYLPEGSRAWGKSRVGLRCLDGAVRWNVYLPVTVKVWGTGLVATGAAVAGGALTAADVATGEVDLAEDGSPALTDADAAVGRALARAVHPGQSLRVSHLKPRQWFGAGETVTVSARGEGFSVAGEGQALNNGIEGQPVRVRIESGRVVTGQPVGERRVELVL